MTVALVPTVLHLNDVRLLPGCAAGLAEPTALVEIGCDGVPDEDFDSRIRALTAALCPEQPFYRLAAGDWPAAFQIGSEDPANTPGYRLGQWLVAVSVALQRWARVPVWRGRVVGVDDGVLRLAVPWRWEWALNEALDQAVPLVAKCANSVVHEDAPSAATARARSWMFAAMQRGMAPNMLRYIQAGLDRDIPFELLDGPVQLGWGAGADRMLESRNDRTSALGVFAANSKFASNMLMANAAMPLPGGEVVEDLDRALAVAEDLGWPVVVKPLNGGQGRAVVPAIYDRGTLERAFRAAREFGSVIVERHVEGDDHRLLVVEGRTIAAAKRTPAGVIGDGSKTVGQLIEQVNADPLRVAEPHGMLKLIVVDEEAFRCLAEQSLTLDAIPEAGRWVGLRRTGNISSGGTAVDVTGAVHPDNMLLAERAARVVGLNIAGVDLLSTDISRSWREVGGAICEINAQPGLRVHWLADPDRDINGEVLDILRRDRQPRIPVTAIVGTSVAGVIAMGVAAMWTAAGKLAGLSSAGMLRIGDDVISTDDHAGYHGGRVLLLDPAVEAAVMEIPVAGVLETGHPCDRYDVVAVFGLDGQGVSGAAEVAARAGVAVVLNADDPGCLACDDGPAARRILVSEDPVRPAVTEHRRRGGRAVLVGSLDGCSWLVLADGDTELPLMPVAPESTVAVLMSAAIGWAHGIEPSAIRAGLESCVEAASTSGPPR